MDEKTICGTGVLFSQTPDKYEWVTGERRPQQAQPGGGHGWELKGSVALGGFPREAQVQPGPHLPRVSGLRNPSSHIAGGMITQAAKP